MPWWLWPWVGLNALAFLLYGWDKLAAMRGARRVPERRLLAASAPFAAPGAWLAVLAFRHKRRKTRYLVQLVLLTGLQAAAAAWLLWQRWA